MTAINDGSGDAAIEWCPDCSGDDHHACIGRPECECPCNEEADDA